MVDFRFCSSSRAALAALITLFLCLISMVVPGSVRGSAPHISLAIDSKYSPPTGFVRISLRLSSEGTFSSVSRLRLTASVTRSPVALFAPWV